MKANKYTRSFLKEGEAPDSRQEMSVRRRQTGAHVVTEPCSGPGASEVLRPGLKELSFLLESLTIKGPVMPAGAGGVLGG